MFRVLCIMLDNGWAASKLSWGGGACSKARQWKFCFKVEDMKGNPVNYLDLIVQKFRRIEPNVYERTLGIYVRP